MTARVHNLLLYMTYERRTPHTNMWRMKEPEMFSFSGLLKTKICNYIIIL